MLLHSLFSCIIFHMPLRSLFSCIIEGSDDKAVPSSCCEQEIELMEALDKDTMGLDRHSM